MHQLLVVVASLFLVGLDLSLQARAGGQKKPMQAPMKESPTLVPQLGHSKAIGSVAFSPDGKQVLTGGSDGIARLWDAASGKEIRALDCGGGAVAFSSDLQFPRSS